MKDEKEDLEDYELRGDPDPVIFIYILLALVCGVIIGWYISLPVSLPAHCPAPSTTTSRL